MSIKKVLILVPVGVMVVLALLVGQTVDSNPRQLLSGSSNPATCIVGAIFFNTTTSGSNIYGCTATNTWTLQGSPSNLVALESHTASSSATLDFTSCPSALYDTTLLTFEGVLPATNAANLQMQVSTNGGSSWDTGSNYISNFFIYRAGGSAANGNGNSAATQFIFTATSGTTGIGNTSARGLHGHIFLYTPTAIDPQYEGNVSFQDGASNWIGQTLQGTYLSTTLPNGIRLKMDTGNIAAGVVHCYGVNH